MAKRPMSQRLLEHTLGVMETAEKLALRHGVAADKAKQGARYHDAFKEFTQEELDQLVIKYNIGKEFMGQINLAHSKVAAAVLELKKKEAKLQAEVKHKEQRLDNSTETMHAEVEIEEDVINAVRYHTTGRANMTELEKIVFLADGIEPSRNYPSVEKIRKLAKENLNMACQMYLEKNIDHLITKGIKMEKIHKDTLDALKFFQKKG